MPLTDAKRRANAKYDRANYGTVAAKLKKADIAAFKAACEAQGTTPNAVLTAYIADYVRKYAPAAQEDTETTGTD